MILNSSESADASQLAELLQGIIDTSSRLITYCESISDHAEGMPSDFVYRLANQGVYSMLALAPQQVLGQRVSVINSPFNEPSILAKLLTVVSTGKPQSFELAGSGDFSNRWYQVDLTAVLTGIVISFSDITTHKEAEQQAGEALQMLQSVLDTAPYSIVYCVAIRNEAGEIIDFTYQMTNRQVEKVLNLPTSQIIGEHMTTLFPGILDDPLFSYYVDVVKDGKAKTFEWHLKLINFNHWYLISTVPFNDGFVASIVDITEFKTLQHQLENTVSELKISNEYLQQFAYIASHDLQEPLRKIQAFSSLMVSDYGQIVGEEGADMLFRIKSAANRMQNLIRDLLAYSRINTQPKSFTKVNLTQLIHDILGDLEINIREQNARITVHELPILMGDSVQLQQLFQNLLTNAIKFVRPDTLPEVVISCSVVSNHDLPSSLLPTQFQYVAISIIDNGIGFDLQHQDRIFQLFQRLHTRNQYQGTGIGLAICKKAAENHQGTIIATSQLDQGSTFSVYLPLNR